MSNTILSHLSALACIGSAALILASCKTTESEPLKPPSLSYKAAAICSQNVSFDAPVQRSAEEKTRKREMRHRTIELKQDMANKDVPCLNDASGQTIPYKVFEIPTGLEKRVVNAGSKSDAVVIFASKISTHDENGGLVREFDESDYRRLGAVYGVQFSPRETERFVLIKADPSLIGNRKETVETEAWSQYVSSYGYNPYGGGGSNTVGEQRNRIRTYSYNGQAVVQTVFPKQKTKK